MEEASAQQQSSAFPAPPFYFQRYTAENLALFNKVTSDPTSASSPDAAKSLGQLPFPILALEPPPPVLSGTYWQFGRPFAIQETLATLEEQGCEQLYPNGSIDRIKELKKLNHSVIFNFLELVHTLSTSPREFAVKVDQIRMIFINMHHILNEYRPHQARETLRLMMQNQLKSKQQETEALKKTCADLREKLATLKALKEQRQLGVATLNSTSASLQTTDMDVDMISPDQRGSSNSASGEKENVDSNARRTRDRLLMMVDDLE